MKKDKIIYWSTTVIIAAMMLMGGVSYFANPEVVTGFKQMGFPDFFRIELGVAKILGALVLLIPQVPSKVKEWTYAGFSIVLVSASILHASIGDPTAKVVTPLILLAILMLSNFYWNKAINNPVVA